ncbi:unnamed protein product [Acanthoscelides obtectus]|uniref:Uncharacterized protein n=1 Tax=Acanthoscelides obtectus TaxID=200917 RepID=A0A9P0PJS5_ACAOB|nr:unnamed protein product [Acanthoscelides obtectus]CAK1622257.1 hypothetical protein AOBTE_LOCUS1404 [Acanthoscelides obtectus]
MSELLRVTPLCGIEDTPVCGIDDDVTY